MSLPYTKYEEICFPNLKCKFVYCNVNRKINSFLLLSEVKKIGFQRKYEDEIKSQLKQFSVNSTEQ